MAKAKRIYRERAPTAPYVPPFDPDTPLDQIPLGPRSRWPRYGPEAQGVIGLFLTMMKAEAIKALNGIRMITEVQGALPWTHNNALYWEHVISAIEWMQSRVPQRHRHLRQLELRFGRGRES